MNVAFGRRSPTLTRTLTTFSLLTAAWLVGCGTTWRRDSEFAKNDVYLYRETPRSSTPTASFSHPVSVSAATVTELLQELTYRHTPVFSQPREERVFSADEVEILAPAARDLLSRLGAHERLRFLVCRPSWANALRGMTGISGVMFSDRPGILNVAFDAVVEGVYEGDGGDPADFQFPYEPTSYRDTDREILPFPGATLAPDRARKGTFPRWLVVDLAILEKETVEGSAVAVTPGPAGTEEESSSEVPAEPQDAHPAGEASEVPAEVLERFRTLEALRKEGLISEPEYLEKRRQLLDGL